MISLWLYCDPSSSSDDPNSPDYSEIGYLGLRSEWQYLGRPFEPGPMTVVTANGEAIYRDGPGPDVSHGEINTHTGPIRTESQVVSRAVTSGDPVEFTITFYAPDPIAAAVLRVVLEPGADGVVLADAQIRQADPR